jgi:PAS domain S-box-containing protein
MLSGWGSRSRAAEPHRAALPADLIIANAPDPVFVSDLEGRIFEANQAVSQLLGLRRAEVLEQSVSRFIVPEETREFTVALREVAERGVTRNVRLNPRSASGEVIPTTLNASALRDATGKVIGVIGILRDMRELDKARAYAESLIKNAPDPVFVSDLEGKILLANDAVSSLLGFHPDELIEQSLSRFIGAEEVQEFVAALREVVARGVSRNVRLTPRSASGEVIPTSLNASALRDVDGKVIGAIGILRDMRSYEQVVRDLVESRRELDAASQAKDLFLAMVSHELRTPLTAMLGWARLLRTGLLDEATAVGGVKVIEQNTKLLAQLIDDLLDVSRIVAGKFRLELRTVDPVAVIEAAINTVQALADAKSISLKAVLDPSAGPIVGDAERLQQVVWNLLSNAIKFTAPQGRIDLRLERVETRARITVQDSGKGIDLALLPHVFDRFRQGEDLRRGGGLGLGLTIVRHIVDAHQGTVRAASEGEGRGATFTVELPLLPQSARAPQVSSLFRRGPAADAPVLTSLAGVRVLAVDDDAHTRDLLKTILRQAGAETMAAGSVGEALAEFDRWKPDVVVTDIGMPGEDGYALLRRIREREQGDGAAVPVLALTAYARAEDRAEALAAGFNRHVGKPIDPAILTALLASLVER